MKSRIYENGGYIYIDSENAKGWHHCEDAEFFANQTEYKGELDDKLLKWTGAPIPKDIMLKVAALAGHYPRMEVAVCLYYNSEDKQWLVNVPKQKGTGAHVKYSDEDFEPPKGYAFLGTIHTHPEMGAFWSGTDRNDQNMKTGLHVVLGLRGGKIDQVLCSLFFNKKQYDQQEAVEIPAESDTIEDCPADWLEKVEQQELPVLEHKPSVDIEPTIKEVYDYVPAWDFDKEYPMPEDFSDSDTAADALDTLLVGLLKILDTNTRLAVIHYYVYEFVGYKEAEKLEPYMPEVMNGEHQPNLDDNALCSLVLDTLQKDALSNSRVMFIFSDAVADDKLEKDGVPLCDLLDSLAPVW